MSGVRRWTNNYHKYDSVKVTFCHLQAKVKLLDLQNNGKSLSPMPSENLAKNYWRGALQIASHSLTSDL